MKVGTDNIQLILESKPQYTVNCLLSNSGQNSLMVDQLAFNLSYCQASSILLTYLFHGAESFLRS